MQLWIRFIETTKIGIYSYLVDEYAVWKLGN